LKTRANENGPGPATYWNKEEQEKLLEKAFQRWAKQGNVWSAAAEKVYYNSIIHESASDR
jgi:hypothetical protein